MGMMERTQEGGGWNRNGQFQTSGKPSNKHAPLLRQNGCLTTALINQIINGMAMAGQIGLGNWRMAGRMALRQQAPGRRKSWQQPSQLTWQTVTFKLSTCMILSHYSGRVFAFLHAPFLCLGGVGEWWGPQAH